MALTDSISSINPAAPVPFPVIEADSLATDSVVAEPEPLYGILLTAPEPPAAAPQRDSSLGLSFILLGLFLLFLVIALRFRNNMKYVGAMFHNLIDTRMRQNVFDDTVRETSLIILLNLLWCASAGIIGYCCLSQMFPSLGLVYHQVGGILFAMALSGVYVMFMSGAYYSVGWVFSDSSHAMLWLKGFAASQALMTPLFFLTALFSLCWPGVETEVAITAGAIFVVARLFFIWKGFRIFFNQFSSWVLFLCYLCSLEIVPLVLTYRLAIFLSEVLT